MRSAYEILGVSENMLGGSNNADDLLYDQSIKQAYLEKVRAFPPEKNPQQFNIIKDAYEAIKTVRHRARYDLFHHPKVNLYQMLEDHFPPKAPIRPSVDLILQVLKESL